MSQVEGLMALQHARSSALRLNVWRETNRRPATKEDHHDHCPGDHAQRRNFVGESAMSIVHRAVGVVSATADATAAAAGAVGGAAVNGIIGGVQGTAAGIRTGLSSGSHSTPAAVLTLAAVGAAGLVDWPVLLAVGGTALVVGQPSGSPAYGEARTPA